MVQHGACLGLGIAAMGTEDDELYEVRVSVRVRVRARVRVRLTLTLTLTLAHSKEVKRLPKSP